jgi:hypothetical protein
MIKLKDILKEAEGEAPKCPVATQNVEVNLEHRQIAIEKYGYGPLNPNNPNVKFWKAKQALWKEETIEAAKSARCNTCAAFNITSRILSCIEKPLASDTVPQEEPVMEDEFAQEPVQAPEPETEFDDTEGADKDAWDTIEAGKLGYCTMHKFKCAGSRTCNAWITGGPIKDKK